MQIREKKHPIGRNFPDNCPPPPHAHTGLGLYEWFENEDFYIDFHLEKCVANVNNFQPKLSQA